MTGGSYSLICLLACWIILVQCTSDDVGTDLEKYLQPDDVGINEIYDTMPDNGILCSRDCTKHPEPRICYYRLYAEQYHAMGPACDGCPANRTACFNPQCVMADGIERTVLTFNRMLPAPGEHVCLGDRIIVDAHNLMPARSLGVHWHGTFFSRAPWNDGSPYVSQCPINEGQVWRYDFEAENFGTLYYHTHSGFQMYDGLAGAFIIRRPRYLEPQRHLYDYDYPSHTVIIQDWMHALIDTEYPGYNKIPRLVTMKVDSFLINGRGPYRGNGIPYAEFNVLPNKRYRFRIVSASNLICSFKVRVQDHNMLLISIDGFPIRPVTVESVTMGAGDLFDVVITTNQKPSSYWIMVEAQDICVSGHCVCTGASQRGILYYRGSGRVIPPRPAPTSIMNLPDFDNEKYGCAFPDIYLCLDHLRSWEPVPPPLLKLIPDYHFTFHIINHQFTESELYQSNSYKKYHIPFAGPGLGGGMSTETLDGKSLMMAPFPLLTQDEPIDDILCPKTCANYCECLNLIKVPLGAVVQVTFIDDNPNPSVQVNHPLHIHGHSLIILKQGNKTERMMTNFATTNFVKNAYPVMRDLTTIPAGGFGVMRFQAINPGFWMFHCHFTVHNHNGMAVIFQVGERNQFVPAPPDLPKCGNYVPPVSFKKERKVRNRPR